MPDNDIEDVAIPEALPKLIIRQSNLPATTYDLRDLLAASNSLFERGRVLVEIKRDANGELFSHAMQHTNVIMKAHEYCQPVQLDRRDNEQPVTLPEKVARLYIDDRQW